MPTHLRLVGPDERAPSRWQRLRAALADLLDRLADAVDTPPPLHPSPAA